MADPDSQQHAAGKVAVELGEVAGDLSGIALPHVEDAGGRDELVVASSSGRSAGSCWEPPSEERAEAELLDQARRFARMLLADPSISGPDPELAELHAVQLRTRRRSDRGRPGGSDGAQSGILLGVSVVPMIGVGKSGGDDLSHLLAP